MRKTFEHFKDALVFRKEMTITLEEVYTRIWTKELHKLQESKTDNNELSFDILKVNEQEKDGGESEEEKDGR